MLYIDPRREKPLKLFLFETRSPMPLIFGTQLCLVDLFQDCSSYSPAAKKWPRSRGHMFYIDPYREKPLKFLKPEGPGL